jgi:predicted lipid carrier protein YhbT
MRAQRPRGHVPKKVVTLMPRVHDQVHKQRRDVLKHARALARSGQHADVASIETAMREVEGFETAQHWFADWSFQAQLNKLCALANDKHDASSSHFARETA